MPANTAKTDSIKTYTQSYNVAMDELAELMTEREEIEVRRDEIERRIDRLREAIVGLGSLCNKSSYEIAKERPELFPDKAPSDLGFTDAVRKIFKEYKDDYFSPVEIRDFLGMDGFDVSKYKNVLASIHSILKRLKAKNEIFEGTHDGKVLYKLNPRGPLAQAPEPPKQELRDEDIPF
jgi:hypothetical protein